MCNKEQGFYQPAIDELDDNNPPNDEDTRPETIDIPVWVKRDSMLIRRDALSADDPDHTYNYVKDVMGLRPEDYGVYHPYDQEFARMSREQLIDEIIVLRRAIETYERMGF